MVHPLCAKRSDRANKHAKFLHSVFQYVETHKVNNILEEGDNKRKEGNKTKTVSGSYFTEWSEKASVTQQHHSGDSRN